MKIESQTVVDRFTTFSGATEIQEMEFALARAGFTHKEVRSLTTGDVLTLFREVLRGNADIVEQETFRETGELQIPIPALERPTSSELRKKLSWIKSITRDSSPISEVTLRLATVLRIGEGDSIDGHEYNRRVMPKHNILLGFQHASWLVDNQDILPGEFRDLLGEVYIDFPGLVVVYEFGGYLIPSLFRQEERWAIRWTPLTDIFQSHGRIAFVGKESG